MSEKDTKIEGNFIESADLMQAGEVTLTIDRVSAPGTEKSSDGKPIPHPVVWFKGTGKGLVCNKTNQKNIKAEYGAKVEKWIGQTIVLRVNYLKKAFGEFNVPTIRVIPQKVPIPFGARKFMGQQTPFDKGDN